MPTLYLVDGHAQFFRAYHAIRTRMTSPVTKEPTHLSYGFTSMLLKLMRDQQPDYLAVVIDQAGDRESFRSEMYPEYKANREAPPEDFRPQVTRCLEVLDRLSIPVIAEPSVEADDVIATIVRRLRVDHPDVTTRIVSKDKDLSQLIDDGIELFDPYKEEIVTPEMIFKTEGVKPEHVVDVLALMGDNVDNIPGVDGIGPKTAAKLILQYGSIDGVLEHIDEIKGKRRENIEKARDTLDLGRRLVTLRDDVENDFDLDASRFDPTAIELEPALALFRELGFNRQQTDLRALVVGDGTVAVATAAALSKAKAPEEGMLFDMFGGADEAATTVERGDYVAVSDAAALDALVVKITAAGAFALTTLQSNRTLSGFAIALEPGGGWYVPVDSIDPSTHLDQAAVLARLGPLLEDAAIGKTGHDIKRDMRVLRRAGVEIRGATFDTMIAGYVVDATRSGYALSDLALAEIGHACILREDVLGSGRNRIEMNRAAVETVCAWAAERADVALRLRAALEPKLTGPLRKLFDEIEAPLIGVLADMEFNGIRVDPDELDRQRERLARRLEDLRKEIGEAAPHPFSPDSPKQLAAALFNKPDEDPPGLGLRPLKRGKTGPSTDVEVLEKLAADPDVETPVPSLIVEYRQLSKLISTYLVALKDAIDETTRRVHATFNQTGAATGRLSASDPNLQNIPIRTDVGREIRRAFVAEEGNRLVAADYSQIELRLLAHLADDPALIAAFDQGEDIHTAVAAHLFDVPPDEVSIGQRSSAKMVNFGIAYGITPWGLARRLGGDTTREEAAQIIEDYKTRFAQIGPFLDECVARAMSDGYVETILGRRRAIPQIHARHPSQRALGERMAINSVVQGSAADLIKIAMIDVHRRLPDAFADARLVLQIHDELVVEAPIADADGVAALLVDRMGAAMDLKVPLVVDASVAETWYESK